MDLLAPITLDTIAQSYYGKRWDDLSDNEIELMKLFDAVEDVEQGR